MAKRRKKNMQIVWVLLAVAAIGILFYGGSKGWFSSTSNTFINPITPTPDKVIEFYSYSNLLSFNPNPACVGDLVTGNIDTNIPNGQCTLFYMGEGWTPYDTFDLNVNGDVSASQVINVAGTQQFQATCCDTAGNCKISNQVSLTVNNCNIPPQPAFNCNAICQAGQYASGYPDTNGCGPEYDPLMDALGHKCCCLGFNNIPPVPNLATCTDTDGGQDDQQFIKGIVSSSVTNTGMMDECDWGTGQLKEYYCKEDKTIGVNYYTCENYWHCDDGACKQQLCQDIMSPTPEKCHAGYTTDGGTCEYWAFNGGMCLSSFSPLI